MVSLLAAAILGCNPYTVGAGRVCAAHAGYATYAPAYAAPAYAAKVQTVYTGTADPYYANLVGDYLRQEAAQRAAQQSAADQKATIDGLRASITTLETTIRQMAAVPPVQAPYQPQYQPPEPAPLPTPQAPPKQSYAAPSPQQPYAAPPIPDKSPGIGAVPPPPQLQAPAKAPDGFLPLGNYGQPAPTNDPSAALTYVFTQNGCGNCHTGAGGAGGLKIFDAPGQLANLSFEQLTDPEHGIIASIDSGRMPKGRPHVPPEHRAMLVGAIEQQVKSYLAMLSRTPTR